MRFTSTVLPVLLLVLFASLGAGGEAYAQAPARRPQQPADTSKRTTTRPKTPTTKPTTPKPATTKPSRRSPARIDSTTARRDTSRLDTARRTVLGRDSTAADSLRGAITADSLGGDSVAARVNNNGVDTVVSYNAADRIVFDVKGRKMYLYRKAELVNGPQKLNADFIRVDFGSSELYARAHFDSTTKKYSDVPLFRNGSQELSANELTYNFKTKRGTLGAAETKFGNGFYYGDRIKQVAPNTYFVRDGRYTTCDAEHPHYFFASPRMKVITGERVFADQVALYISDVPVFYIPFGVYFPNRGGRQSGLIIPKFGTTAARGFSLEGIGFFFDLGDYIDTRLMFDLYSKGGYTARNYFRWRVKPWLEQFDLNLTYGRTRYDPDDDYTESRIADFQLQLPLSQRTHIGGNISVASENAIRNTTTETNPLIRTNDITTTNLTSNLSFTTSWRWGGQLSINYQRTQSVVTRDLTQSLPFSFRLPTWTPFTSASGEGALDNLSLGLSADANFQREQRDTLPDGSYRVDELHRGFTYHPSISISPHLGYVTLQPFFSYTGSIFDRRIFKQAAGDTISVTTIYGLYHTFSYNFGVSFSTNLYGIVQPRIFGINAIRHTLSPTISFSYTPDFGQRSYGFYDQFFNPVSNRIERYSLFERDQSAASIPGSGLQEAMSISLQNNFEAKLAQGDTLPDKKVNLLSLGLSTSCNFAADSVRWNPISASANTNLGAIGYLSGNATFELYETDSLGRAINVFLWDSRHVPVRMTSAGISFGTSFSDRGFTTGATQAAASDSVGARRARFDFQHIAFDDRSFFGEQVEGDPQFQLPWQAAINGSYNLSRMLDGSFNSTFNLNLNFSFSLTQTTRIESGATYSFDIGRFVIPTISLVKDLHCWEMRLDWRPGSSGFSRGFYFRIGLKAPELQDVKIERQGYSYQ